MKTQELIFTKALPAEILQFAIAFKWCTNWSCAVEEAKDCRISFPLFSFSSRTWLAAAKSAHRNCRSPYRIDTTQSEH